MITLDEILKLRKLEAEATPGDWDYGHWSGQCHEVHAHGYDACKYEYTLRREYGTDLVLKDKPITLVTSNSEYFELSQPNAELITSLRNSAPDLIELAIWALEAKKVMEFYACWTNWVSSKHSPNLYDEMYKDDIEEIPAHRGSFDCAGKRAREVMKKFPKGSKS